MVKNNLKTETTQELSAFTLIDDKEQLTGNNCPKCSYPTVIEYGLEVCYHCGWSKDEEPEGYFDD